MRSPKDMEIMNKEVSSYIKRKLLNRKYNRRPLELKYLHIGKATGYTYQQVRNVMDRLVKTKIIEKFKAWEKTKSGHYRQKNYYRIIIK